MCSEALRKQVNIVALPHILGFNPGSTDKGAHVISVQHVQFSVFLPFLLVRSLVSRLSCMQHAMSLQLWPLDKQHILLRQGLCLLESETWMEAAQQLQAACNEARAVHDRQTESEALLGLARVKGACHQPKEAIDLLDQALSLDATSLEIHVQMLETKCLYR
jgi:hypothetical protein